MSWNINELDKNKVEQCIVNETIRIESCKESLNKLKNEYEQKRHKYMTALSNIEDKITNLETSISSGENFLEQCKNRLKSLSEI